MLCPVSRPVTTLVCVLLKDNSRTPIARSGPEINSWACLCVLQGPACWIPKATDTHTDCVILIAFSTTTVAWTHLNVTLYGQCLSCYSWVVSLWHTQWTWKKGYNATYRLKFLTTFKVVPEAAFRLMPTTENVANATGILSCANLCHFAPDLKVSHKFTNCYPLNGCYTLVIIS